MKEQVTSSLAIHDTTSQIAHTRVSEIPNAGVDKIPAALLLHMSNYSMRLTKKNSASNGNF